MFSKIVTFLLVALLAVGVSTAFSGGDVPEVHALAAPGVEQGALSLPDFDLSDAIALAVSALALLQGLPRLLSLIGQVLVYFNVLDPGPIAGYIKLIMAAVFVGLFVASILGAVPVILQIDSTINGYVGILAQLLILMGIPVSFDTFKKVFSLPPRRFSVQ